MIIDFEKGSGLVPVIIQHAHTLQVLMLGYMDQAALDKTVRDNQVTFFSRSKNRLWTKGETSGNFLEVTSIQKDCDDDALLIKAIPKGPTCHTGSTSCFQEKTAKGFVYQLQNIIEQRIESGDAHSYTQKLYKKGISKVAQKVGEEAVELVIEAMKDNRSDFENEAADLLFHYLLLLKMKGMDIEAVEAVLQTRNESA